MLRRLTALALVIGALVAPASAQAWSVRSWYLRWDTQCVVRHEGGWTSVSRGGTYHGRFQMNYAFETETSYGRWAERRYGRASRWPPAVQIAHAYEVWRYAGWSRWPTYRHYCT